MNAGEAFDRSAQIYDRARRQLVYCFDDFYGTALERLPFGEEDEFHALDLGAGTGLLSLLLSRRFPRARFTLLDLAEEMLSRARERFAGQDAFRFVTADFATALFPGPFDAVVSALAIHHLEDDQKRGLYRRVLEALRPGGVFVNADQVAGATPSIERAFHEKWLREVRALEVGEADLAAALERMKADRMSPVEPQLAWLRDAGFVEVDCWYKHHRFAVFSGEKPRPSSPGPAPRSIRPPY